MRKIPSKPWKNSHFENITEGFSQKLGYFGCRFACPPTFRPDPAIAWPAFWLYNKLSNHLFEPPQELDICELYRSSRDNVTEGDPAHHTAHHYHDNYTIYSYPGFINRDYAASGQLMNPKTEVTGAWGGAAWDFEDMHEYGMLLSPRWCITYLDGIEVNRFPMIDEWHQRMYMLITHAVSSSQSGTGSKLGLTDFSGSEDVIVDMEVDWCKVWQNPDWADLVIGGTANAKTVTTTLGFASYAASNELVIIGISTAANTTTTPTLNPTKSGGSALGAKVIKKHSDWENQQPWTGALIALAIGDITANGVHAYEWNHAGDCFILLNPGRSWSNNPKLAMPVLGTSLIEIDRQEIESTIAAKFAHMAQMPADHPVQDLGLNPGADRYPRPKPSVDFDVVIGRQPGYVIGRLLLTNTPTVPGRWSLSDTSLVDINPATGDLFVNAGVTLALTPVDDPHVTVAYCTSPGLANPDGANVCLVTIRVINDIPYELTALGSTLQMDIDWAIPAFFTKTRPEPLLSRQPDN